jgi:hypothetical protein
MKATFIHGEDFDETFETVCGLVRVVATVSIEGEKLTLNDFAIFPKGAIRMLPIGTAQVLRIFGQIKLKAREAGFARIALSADRLTGAKRGRIISKERSLL